MCDCGDAEAWTDGVACEVHQHGQDEDMEEVRVHVQYVFRF